MSTLAAAAATAVRENVSTVATTAAATEGQGKSKKNIDAAASTLAPAAVSATIVK